MKEQRKTEVLETLKKERYERKMELDALQMILRDLDEEGDGGIPKTLKKYVSRKKIHADTRVKIQTMADLSCVIIALEKGKEEVEIMGSLYKGELYPEIQESLQKAGLFVDENEKGLMVSLD